MSDLRSSLPVVAGVLVGLVAATLAGIAVSNSAEPPDDPAPARKVLLATAGAPACGITLALASSVEKLPQMKELARRYNLSRKCPGKAPIDVFDAGPGSVLDGLAGEWRPEDHSNRPRPDAWSPNASLSVDLLRSRAADDGEPDPVAPGSGWTLNSTPMVLAVPETVADRLVEKLGSISWHEIFTLARDPREWDKVKAPGWGPLLFGKTNPRMSTMGLQTFVEEFADAAGRADPSTLVEREIGDATVQDAVERIESNVPHYATTSLDFLCNLARADQEKRASQYVTMVPVEEKSVIEYNAGKQTTGQGTDCEHAHPPSEPLVPIYPTDGVFFTDSPLAVLATTTPEQRRLAADFAAFVQTTGGQRVFQDAGFRNIHGALDRSGLAGYTARLDDDPAKRLLPSPEVLNAVREAWDDVRRPARVVLLLDMSLSMRCKVDDRRNGDECEKFLGADVSKQRFALAREALRKVLTAKLLGPHDRVAVHTLGEPGPGGTSICRRRTGALVPAGEAAADLPDWRTMGRGTPLYQCVTESQKWLADQDDRENYINAVVVLTDGENDYPGMSIEQAVERMKAERVESGVRVFPIAYVDPTLNDQLERLAAAGEGTLRLANDPTRPGTSADKIDLIMREVISNF